MVGDAKVAERSRRAVAKDIAALDASHTIDLEALKARGQELSKEDIERLKQQLRLRLQRPVLPPPDVLSQPRTHKSAASVRGTATLFGLSLGNPRTGPGRYDVPLSTFNTPRTPRFVPPIGTHVAPEPQPPLPVGGASPQPAVHPSAVPGPRILSRPAPSILDASPVFATPGPGAYDLPQGIGQPSRRLASSVACSIHVRTPVPGACEARAKPGPGAYDPLYPGTVSTIAAAERNKMQTSWLPQRTAPKHLEPLPGPGAYLPIDDRPIH